MSERKPVEFKVPRAPKKVTVFSRQYRGKLCEIAAGTYLTFDEAGHALMDEHLVPVLEAYCKYRPGRLKVVPAEQLEAKKPVVVEKPVEEEKQVEVEIFVGEEPQEGVPIEIIVGEEPTEEEALELFFETQSPAQPIPEPKKAKKPSKKPKNKEGKKKPSKKNKS